jgi:hypothetical protein
VNIGLVFSAVNKCYCALVGRGESVTQTVNGAVNCSLGAMIELWAMSFAKYYLKRISCIVSNSLLILVKENAGTRLFMVPLLSIAYGDCMQLLYFSSFLCS